MQSSRRQRNDPARIQMASKRITAKSQNECQQRKRKSALHVLKALSRSFVKHQEMGPIASSAAHKTAAEAAAAAAHTLVFQLTPTSIQLVGGGMFQKGGCTIPLGGVITFEGDSATDFTSWSTEMRAGAAIIAAELRSATDQLCRDANDPSATLHARSPAFWSAVRQHSYLTDMSCGLHLGAEKWVCGALMNAVGIVGADAFVAMVHGATPCGMGVLAFKEEVTGGAVDFLYKIFHYSGSDAGSDGVFFDYFNGLAVKTRFPRGAFAQEYRFNRGSIDRRNAIPLMTKIGTLVAQRLSFASVPAAAADTATSISTDTAAVTPDTANVPRSPTVVTLLHVDAVRSYTAVSAAAARAPPELPK